MRSVVSALCSTWYFIQPPKSTVTILGPGLWWPWKATRILATSPRKETNCTNEYGKRQAKCNCETDCYIQSILIIDKPHTCLNDWTQLQNWLQSGKPEYVTIVDTWTLVESIDTSSTKTRKPRSTKPNPVVFFFVVKTQLQEDPNSLPTKFSSARLCFNYPSKIFDRPFPGNLEMNVSDLNLCLNSQFLLSFLEIWALSF